MRNPITVGIALLLVILAIVACVLFCCKGEDNNGTDNENDGEISNPDNGGSDDDSNNGGLEIDLGGSLGDDLFNGDNLDPDGWTKID